MDQYWLNDSLSDLGSDGTQIWIMTNTLPLIHIHHQRLLLTTSDTVTDKNTKKAIELFIKPSFEEAFVAFDVEVYKSNIGTPTGGSLSRQIADMFTLDPVPES